MSIRAIIMIRDKCTSGIVPVNRLALFSDNTSDGGSESGGNLAGGPGVGGDLVECVFVDTFDDVDFPVVGPVVSDGPVCWPGTAAVGHRVHVGDEQAAGIVFLLGVYVDTRGGDEIISIDIRNEIDIRDEVIVRWRAWGTGVTIRSLEDSTRDAL